MSIAEQISEDANTLYLSIIGGNLSQKVEENTPGAKRREYETKDGATGVKFELHYKNLVGKISGMEFKDGDFGEQFILSLTKWEDNAKIHMSTDSRYFTAFAKKLPNVNVDEEITLNSFDFTTKDGKQLRGLDIKQGEEKIIDAYWDADKKKALKGIPSVSDKDAKGYDKDDWKMFFMTVKKFLKKEVQATVLPTTSEQPLDISDADDVFEDASSIDGME